MPADDRGVVASITARLGEELAALIRLTAALDPEPRAERLTRWITERTDASRCAVVPFERGSFGPPLALHHRGTRDPRQLPRGVLQAAARARHSVVSHDELDSPTRIAGVEAASFMAAPVVFRGDVLAVIYLDCLERRRRFTGDEQATLQAVGYELARPLLGPRERQWRRDYDALRDEMLRGAGEHVVPVSPALARVLTRADALAPYSSESLLIVGETGVGKEWLARRVHERSGRAGPFVPVSVSAIPSGLIEAELFGSVRGAFTGAVDRRGQVAEASGGTLFLDEIGDLALADQVKLLRFLQDRRVRAVGGREETDADVRIVAATNRDVRRMTREGSFRADLLHRFGPPLEVPPLRSRRQEILPLTRKLLARRALEVGVATAELDESTCELIQRHSWPGNVRQLQAVLSHALVLAPGGRIEAALLDSLLDADDTAVRSERPATWAGFRAWVEGEERAWIAAALEASGGNAEAAARAMGCPRTTLRNRMRRLGLPSAG